jgi:integrase
MAVRHRTKKDGKGFYFVDFRYRWPDGKEERFREKSPVNTKKGAAEYERQLRQALLDGSYKAALKAEEEAKKAQEEEVKRREAERLAEEERKKEAANVLTFEKFSSSFMKFAKNNNKPSEVKNKEKILRLYLNPFFGDMPLAGIGTEDVEVFKAAMLEDDYKVHTVNNMLAALSKLFNLAIDYGKIPTRPKTKTLKKDEDEEVEFLSVSQAKALIANVDDAVKGMVIFALHTGLRIGELRALYWSDIDFKRRIMTVRRNLWNDELGTTKSGRNREVSLDNEAVKVLQGLQRHLHSDFVFCHQDGTPYCRNQGYSYLRTGAKRAGIVLRRGNVGWHTLRHTFASHLAMEGKTMLEIQKVLGHADIKMTMKYAHLSPEKIASTTLCLDSVFGEPVSEAATA